MFENNQHYFCEDQFLNEHVHSIIFHSIIVSHLAYKVGAELGLSKECCYELALAGILHDIGKIHLDYQLKNKEEIQRNSLGMEEIRYVRNHTMGSYQALKQHGYSDYIMDAILYHHENYDGTGYPDRLNGADIPEGARILRVCDVFAALVDRRLYRDALDLESAVETMVDEVKNYDMKIFLAFQRVINDPSMKDLVDWIVANNMEMEAREQKAAKKRRMRKREKRNESERKELKNGVN